MSSAPPPGVHRRQPMGGWPDPPAPTASELFAAAGIVRAAHEPTPLIRSHPLSRTSGRDVFLKLEGSSAVRSFKFRGALGAIAAATADHPKRPVVTASTGNHGQGMAFAGSYHGVGVTVVAPNGTLPEKRRAMEMLGATVIVAGGNLTEAEDHAREVARREGALYIEDGESPHLMVGAASVALEMLDAEPDLDVILVPVGGGNLIAATLLAVAARESSATVIGVQSSAAPGATMSWLEGEIVRHASNTYAGGLATERPGELSLRVMTRLLPTMILVTDDDLVRVTGEAFRTLGLVVEGAAAAPLAALSLHPAAIDGRQVGVVVTGSWLSADQLTASLA